MRILGPIVLPQALLMASRQSHLRLGRAVRAQFVRHQHIGCEALFLEQLAHQFHGCSLLAPSFATRSRWQPASLPSIFSDQLLSIVRVGPASSFTVSRGVGRPPSQCLYPSSLIATLGGDSRSALADHVRNPELGPQVPISESWY